ncbi:hypothetical protein V6N12_024510 [Hibiscus sabdariffa]|uniref:Uncharacterized protein n=1 Tax=Hibiscus sabdariffa TaxID=183260 RepID=A0ABR2G1A3_9ROSI
MGMNEKWCLIGDLNIVARPEEKLGGAPYDQTNARWYLDFLGTSCLMKIPMKGGLFTWSNHRSDEDAIAEKLDRALASVDWSTLFTKAIVRVEETIALLNNQGEWMKKDEDITTHLQNHFQEVYTKDQMINFAPISSINH